MNRLEEIPGSLQRYAISRSVAPAPGEREVIQRRRAELVASLVPAQPAEIGELFIRLRASLGGVNLDELSARIEAASVEEALAGFPRWAIANVCQRFATGAIQRRTTMCPNTAELVPACVAVVQPVAEEIAKLDRILGAEVYELPSEEERAASAARVQSYIAATLVAADPDRADDERRAKERAHRMAEGNDTLRDRELAAHGIEDGAPVSLGMRAKLAQWAEEERQDAERDRLKAASNAMRQEGEAKRGRAA